MHHENRERGVPLTDQAETLVADPAQLRAQLELLGLPVPWLATEWGVSEGTVRGWLRGTREQPIPPWIVKDIAQIRADTEQKLSSLVTHMAESGDKLLHTYRNDEEYDRARNEDSLRHLASYCAAWHRMLCARALLQLDGRGVGIAYRYPLKARQRPPQRAN